MIIIDRKKILKTIGIVTIFIFAYIITGINVKNSVSKNNSAVATVALPTNKKVIVIDARSWRS